MENIGHIIMAIMQVAQNHTDGMRKKPHVLLMVKLGPAALQFVVRKNNQKK